MGSTVTIYITLYPPKTHKLLLFGVQRDVSHWGKSEELKYWCCHVKKVMWIWSLYAHKCTIWVNRQISLSIFNLLKQENRHLTNMFYSMYLVLFREVYPCLKNYHSPVICEHTFYRHSFLLCKMGPPEQIVNGAGYMESYSELISGCLFCIFPMDLYVSVLVFQDQTS